MYAGLGPVAPPPRAPGYLRRVTNPAEIQVVVHGLPLAVLHWRVADERPPVVILHGYLEQAAAWHDVALRLDRNVFALDHRGHGRSGHVGVGGFYHFWDYVSDLDGVIDALHPHAPVDLVGHSMGGTVATLFAANRPEKVRRLVLVEGLGPQGDTAGMIAARAKAFLDGTRDRPRHKPLVDLDDAVRRLQKANPELHDDVARRLAARITRPARPDDPHVEGPIPAGALVWTWDPLHRARSPWPFDPAVFRDHLSRVRAPTRVIWGSRSPYPDWLGDAAAREAALPHHDRVVVPDAGHLLHLDQPAAVAAAIRAHLDAPDPE